VHLDGTVPADELQWMVDHSFELIVKSLKKADRAALGL
jgi:predicted DNA-binding protein (MmcQ/YjbR family)